MTDETPQAAQDAPSYTYMMRSGSNVIFASNDAPERGKLRRRGWERITLPQAARTMGSKGALMSAVAHCGGGEIERISELGEIRIICHGHGAADTNATTDWEHNLDKRNAAAARAAASIPAGG